MSLYVQVPIQQIADGLTAIGWSSGGGGGDASLTYSATAPSSPTNGVLWYDTTSETLKMYNGGIWSTVSVSQSVITQIQGYASASSLSATSAEDAASAAIAAKNAITGMQVATGAAGSNVTWDGTTLTVPQGLQGIKGLKGDSGATAVTTTLFTATASQTTFSTPYTVNEVWVYLNGVKLASNDYTANNGTSIILSTGANAGDSVEVVKFSEMVLNGSYTTEQIDAFLATKANSTHTHTKADVGLNNVDNTSDANKPISTATQTALDLKANLSSNTYTAPQRTNTTASTNAIDFRLANNFTINATAANITTVSLLGCTGQSGVLVINNAQNITGWGVAFMFKTVPTGLSGTEVFAYYIESETNVRIGKLS